MRFVHLRFRQSIPEEALGLLELSKAVWLEGGKRGLSSLQRKGTPHDSRLFDLKLLLLAPNDPCFLGATTNFQKSALFQTQPHSKARAVVLE